MGYGYGAACERALSRKYVAEIEWKRVPMNSNRVERIPLHSGATRKENGAVSNGMPRRTSRSPGNLN